MFTDGFVTLSLLRHRFKSGCMYLSVAKSEFDCKTKKRDTGAWRYLVSVPRTTNSKIQLYNTINKD